MLTGSRPWPGLTHQQTHQRVAVELQQLQWPPCPAPEAPPAAQGAQSSPGSLEAAPHLAALMQQLVQLGKACTAPAPAARPTAEQVEAQLAAWVEALAAATP